MSAARTVRFTEPLSQTCTTLAIAVNSVQPVTTVAYHTSAVRSVYLPSTGKYLLTCRGKLKS